MVCNRNQVTSKFVYCTLISKIGSSDGKQEGAMFTICSILSETSVTCMHAEWQDLTTFGRLIISFSSEPIRAQ